MNTGKLAQHDPSADRYRIGSDIGGTFTDCILYDQQSGQIWHEKVLTTPEDPADGVATGCRQLIAANPAIVGRTQDVIHGTTLAINAILERNGARTGLLTTAGFRDVLEMRAYMRADMYDVFGDLPQPLVPREHRHEVAERLRADGTVLTPLDDRSVREAVEALRDSDVESIAVCLVHSYLHDAHERRVAELIAEVCPGAAVSLSSEILPQIGEYERTSSTTANAYVQPIVERYLERLATRLADLDLSDNLLLMLSGGGVAAVGTAKRFPVRLVESGPVAGVVAAKYFGELSGARDVLGFDMGGTTAKASLIQAGEIPITSDYEVDRVHHFRKGSGIPLAVPAVDIIEVGTGGGSIAGIDDLGRVKVGPHSAGAHPGPACYGLGGTEPTVTDADLVLGYLDADFFLGGKMALDASAAERAVAERIADPMGMGVTEAAQGIVEIAVENMVSAIRTHVAETGGDPASATLVASGGAGPVHAYSLLRKLRGHQLVLPRGAGVMSALGMLIAPVAFDLVQTLQARLEEIDLSALEAAFAGLEENAANVLADARPDVEPAFARTAELRYVGQGYDLTVPVPERLADEGDRATLAARFQTAYEKRYGYRADAPVEVIAVRLRATVPGGELGVSRQSPVPAPSDSAMKNRRQAYDADSGAFCLHAVYDRYELRPGMTGAGPAIVEERESTAIVGSEATFAVDEYGSLIVSQAPTPYPGADR